MPENISDELIIEVVDKGINSLGKNSAQMLWSILENDYGLAKAKIPENLPVLMDALQKIFGMGYNFIDLLFQTLLQQMTGENIENKTFIQSVTELRKNANSRIQKQTSEMSNVECCSTVETLQKKPSG